MNFAKAFPRFWRFYFFLCLILTGIGVIITLVKAYFAGAGFLNALINGLFFFLLFFPLYSYAWQRKFSPRFLALIFFLCFSFSALISLGMMAYAAWINQSTIVWVLLALWVILSPYMLALHQYVFRSPDFWGSSPRQKSPGLAELSKTTFKQMRNQITQPKDWQQVLFGKEPHKSDKAEK